MKPILILTAGYGEGHNTAARNIASAIEYLGGQAEVVDPFEETYGQLNKVVQGAYIFSINRAPRLWQLFYNLLDQNPSSIDRLKNFKGLISVLETRIRQQQPGTVISTYPVYNFLFSEIFGEGKSPFHQATMVTDSISINTLWSRGYSDRFYVPNEDTAEVFRERKVPMDRVTVSGFPVQMDFALPDRRLEPSDLAHHTPDILYVVNSGKQRAPAVVNRLLKKTDWNLTIAVGRDEKLKEHLSRQVAPWAGRATVIGWTREMPRLLMTHHLLISKAGGATVQEAIAAGCPILINQVVPGQEEGNYELIKENRAGTFASSPEQILERARYCFADGGTVWKEWRDNLLKLGQPLAALKIARDLMEAADQPLTRSLPENPLS